MNTDQNYTLSRDGARDLVITGRILAEVSGQRPGLPKWTELRIYRTDTGRYYLARDRYSTLPGDRTIHEVIACNTVDELLVSLQDQNHRLGPLSKEALIQASRLDPAICPEEVEAEIQKDNAMAHRMEPHPYAEYLTDKNRHLGSWVLIKASCDPFFYMVTLRNGQVIHFTELQVIDREWVHLVEPKTDPQTEPVFERGIDVRLSEIVSAVDAPLGS